jgi:hypothetical protein
VVGVVRASRAEDERLGVRDVAPRLAVRLRAIAEAMQDDHDGSRLRGGSPEIEIEWLREHRVRVAAHAQGREVRLRRNAIEVLGEEDLAVCDRDE